MVECHEIRAKVVVDNALAGSSRVDGLEFSSKLHGACVLGVH